MSDKKTTDYDVVRRQVNVLSKHVLRRSPWIILGAIAAGGIGYAVSFLISPSYESKSRFILGKATSGASQFGSLASLAGLTGRTDGDPSLFSESTLEDLIHSPHVTDSLLQVRWSTLPENGSAELSTYALLKLDSNQVKVPHAGVSKSDMNALKMKEALASSIEIKKSATGIWSLTTVAFDPIVAKEMNSKLLGILREISESEKFNKGVRNRRFLEKRFATISDELKDAEASYGRFMSSNHGLQDPNLVQKQRAYQRNVQMKEAMYIELGKQLELARMEEAKEQISMVVFEAPNMPLYKTRPRRKQIAVASGMLGGGVILAFFVIGGLKRPEFQTA